MERPINEEGVDTLTDFDDYDDQMLVQYAREGDREAFGELIRRHRSQMFGYAYSVTRESFLAEDIVQEAIMRAFLHLGTLAHADRFLPWLQRIIRNQAYSGFRRKTAAKEMPFSAFQQAQTSGSTAVETEPGSLDTILLKLSRSFSEQAKSTENPEQIIMRGQLLEMISNLLTCLNSRERAVFEAHFYEHLSPQEAAKQFSLSSANIYQILSRSRKKMIEQKNRFLIDQYLLERRDEILLNTTNQLNSQMGMNVPMTWTSVGWALTCVLSYTEQKLSLPMVMGLTGHAFRITICRDDVHIAGPTMYPFQKVLSHGLYNLGWSCQVIETKDKREVPGENVNLIDPSLLTHEARKKRALQHELVQALELIHRSVDRGWPVLAWDLFIPEFAVIYGYDDEERRLQVLEPACAKENSLAYDDLGRGTLEDLFVLALKEKQPKSLRSMLKDALPMILDHYQGRDEPVEPGVRGLSAYDSWMDAFRSGGIEPNGNAYNIAVVQDARRLAAEFWKEIGAEFNGGSEEDNLLRKLSGEASELYGQIAEQLQVLVKLFPFPSGGDPQAPENREQAIAVLKAVKSLEERAIVLLERMLAMLYKLNQ